MPARHPAASSPDNIQPTPYNEQPPLKQKKRRRPFQDAQHFRPYPALRSLLGNARRMRRERVGNSRRIAHKQRHALHSARRPGPAALASPWAARGNPVIIRLPAQVFPAAARPGSRASASADRPTAPTGLLLISNFARTPVRHPRPRRFVALRTFAWQLPLGRRSTISYTQQVYFYSNSYGIVG